ncbi:MAG: hypothetical protein AAGC73_06455 [Verrucomicrobiota bacterium]
MSNLPNLTNEISRLRDRKGGSVIVSGTRQTPKPKGKQARERKFASDSFMLFVYGLLAMALLTQLALIVWLDLT